MTPTEKQELVDMLDELKRRVISMELYLINIKRDKE